MSMRTVITGRGSTTSNTATTRWAIGCTMASPVTTPTEVKFPCAGTVVGFGIYQTTTPSASNSRTYTIRQNGSNSSMAITISNPSVSGSTTANPVTFSTGDTISIDTTATAGDATGTIFYYLIIKTANNKSIMFSNPSTAMNTTTTQYIGVNSVQTWNTSATQTFDQYMPTSGTFKNATVNLSGSPGVGKNYTFTLYKNDSPTSIVVTIADTATSGSDTIHTVNAVATDSFQWQQVPTGTPTSRLAATSIEFDPTTNGESVHMNSWRNGPTTSTNYRSPSGTTTGTEGFSSTESDVDTLFPACSIYNLYAQAQAAPASGKSIALTVRDNGSDTALTCTLDSTHASNSDTTHTITTSDLHFLTISQVPTNSPSLRTGQQSFVTWIKPTADDTGFMALLRT